jgi:hypothetical protein
LAIALPGLLSAQGGDHGPVILRLPAGARTLALGNTGVASRDDEVIFFNPAQLVQANGFSASGEWLSSTAGTGSLSAVTRFNGGGIGIGVRMANYELPASVYPATRLSMLDSGSYAATSFEASIGMGQTIKGYRVGAAAKYAAEVAGGVRLSRPLADVGVARDFFRTSFGLSVQNIGKDMDFGARLVKLPLRTTLGAQRQQSFGPYDFMATAAVSVIRDEFVQPSGGLEMNYSWLSGYNVALRAGVRRAAIGEEWFTAGAGFSLDRVSLDYALETLANQRVGHRFGLRVR